MNKRERVIAAFRGEEVDHVPVCMWKHVPREYWADDDKFVACQLNSYKVTDVDFMKLSGDKFFGWPAPALEGITEARQLYDIRPIGADCSLHDELPEEKIRWVVEAARKI